MSFQHNSESSTPSYSSSSSGSVNLPTPTPIYEQVPIVPPSTHTCYTPPTKRTRRSLFYGSPSPKEKINDIHHYQRKTMELQLELYYEKRVNAKHLSFLEQVALKLCGSSSKNTVHQLSPVCSLIRHIPWEPSPQR